MSATASMDGKQDENRHSFFLKKRQRYIIETEYVFFKVIK